MCIKFFFAQENKIKPSCWGQSALIECVSFPFQTVVCSTTYRPLFMCSKRRGCFGGPLNLSLNVDSRKHKPACSSAMSCHALPCPAMPCHSLPCPTMPCHSLFCHSLPWKQAVSESLCLLLITSCKPACANQPASRTRYQVESFQAR